MGFSYSGSHEYHYESLRRRYDECTHVIGNLEITNLNNGNVTYDLGFLSKVKVVTGYVLLGLLNVETIPLKRLRFIRADEMMKIGSKEYGLVVALTSEGTPTTENPNPGLKEIQLQSLREISQGKVMITQNPTLCYMDTIDWSVIVNGSVEIKDTGNNALCGQCHKSCKDSSGVSHCWGHSSNMCQNTHHVQCDSECTGRCFGEGPTECCHEQCAIGCWNVEDTDCVMCRNYQWKGHCVPECPIGWYAKAQDCIEIDKNFVG
ncbi:Receptor tyrosine-protein kinase erbB-3 [Mactra antiquata]